MKTSPTKSDPSKSKFSFALILKNFFSASYVPALLSKPVRASVVVLFTGWTLASVYLVTTLRFAKRGFMEDIKISTDLATKESLPHLDD